MRTADVAPPRRGGGAWGSFAATAIGELKEEAGLTVAEDDLIPFATLSEVELHTIIYPSGDETPLLRDLLSCRALARPPATGRLGDDEDRVCRPGEPAFAQAIPN
jgi:hypothetical protein